MSNQSKPSFNEQSSHKSGNAASSHHNNRTVQSQARPPTQLHNNQPQVQPWQNTAVPSQNNAPSAEQSTPPDQSHNNRPRTQSSTSTITLQHQTAAPSQNSTHSHAESRRLAPNRKTERTPKHTGSQPTSAQTSLQGPLSDSRNSQNSTQGTPAGTERVSDKTTGKRSSQEPARVRISAESYIRRGSAESDRHSIKSGNGRIAELQLPRNDRAAEESFFHLNITPEEDPEVIDEPLWLRPKAPYIDPENTGETELSIPRSPPREGQQPPLLEGYKSGADKRNKETQYEKPTNDEAQTHFILGILSIICCIVCSILSIKNSVQVRRYKKEDNSIRAKRSSNKAIIYGVIAVLTGMVIYMSLTAAIALGFLRPEMLKGILPSIFFPNDAV